jgi:hypothetical protein
MSFAALASSYSLYTPISSMALDSFYHPFFSHPVRQWGGLLQALDFYTASCSYWEDSNAGLLLKSQVQCAATRTL